MARALMLEEQERLTERAIAAATYSQSDVTSTEIESEPVDVPGTEAASFLDLQGHAKIVSGAVLAGNLEALSSAARVAECLRSIDPTPLQAVRVALANVRQSLVTLQVVQGTWNENLVAIAGRGGSYDRILGAGGLILTSPDDLTSLVISPTTFTDAAVASDRPFERLDQQRDEGMRFQGVLDSAWSILSLRYRDRFVSRVRLLALELDEDDPGRIPSVESLQHMVWFLTANPAVKYPDIVLTPDGFFMAEWHRSKDCHLAVTFLPDGEVRFVVFAKPPRTRLSWSLARVDRQSGITSIHRLMTVLAPFAVHRWVYG